MIENFGDRHNPTDNSNHTCYGTFDSDGGTYEVWRKWRVNAPSIIGTATFPQYWSVRTRRHTGGTINTTKHFEKWEKAGLPLGRHRDGMGEFFFLSCLVSFSSFRLQFTDFHNQSWESKAKPVLVPRLSRQVLGRPGLRRRRRL